MSPTLEDFIGQHQWRHAISNSPLGHVCEPECMTRAVGRWLKSRLADAVWTDDRGVRVVNESQILALLDDRPTQLAQDPGVTRRAGNDESEESDRG